MGGPNVCTHAGPVSNPATKSLANALHACSCGNYSHAVVTRGYTVFRLPLAEARRVSVVDRYLSLFDGGAVPVAHRADVETLLSFQVTLTEELLHDALVPLAIERQRLGRVAQIGTVYQRLQHLPRPYIRRIPRVCSCYTVVRKNPAVCCLIISIGLSRFNRE